MGRLPLDRVLPELSEHDQVGDYDALSATLAPFRAAGLRLAIDDVGAGFSSLRHIVITSPDVIKIDRSIVAGLDTDPVLSKLVQSLVDFGHGPPRPRRGPHGLSGSTLPYRSAANQWQWRGMVRFAIPAMSRSEPGALVASISRRRVRR